MMEEEITTFIGEQGNKIATIFKVQSPIAETYFRVNYGTQPGVTSSKIFKSEQLAESFATDWTFGNAVSKPTLLNE